MTDLKKLSEEMAEEYAAKKYGIPTHYSETEDFKAGFNSCLDLLAKQSGEYQIFHIRDADCRWGEWLADKDQALNGTELKVIDHAAYLSAQAKIAQLEEENLKLSNAFMKAHNEPCKNCHSQVSSRDSLISELQQLVKELESEVEDRKESYSKLDDFNINLNEKIKELEQENMKLNQSCCDYQGEQMQALKTKLTTLEAKLQEATDLIRKFHPEDFRYEESEDLVKEVLVFLKASKEDLKYYLSIDDEEELEAITRTYLQNKGG